MAPKLQASAKLLDQMQPHRDITRYMRAKAGPGESAIDFKRISQHRVQQMPLGGFVGERVSKSISILDSLDAQPEGLSSTHELIRVNQPTATPAEREVVKTLMSQDPKVRGVKKIDRYDKGQSKEHRA